MSCARPCGARSVRAEAMATQLFADESKRRGFVLIAAEYPADEVANRRAVVRRALRPGQRRIHFKSEANSARRSFLSVLADQPPRIHVFTADAGSMKQSRAACLEALVAYAVNSDANRLVVERDETRDIDDRRVLTKGMHAADRHVPWELAPPHVEPLLWVADALAWCWPHPDRRWRRLVDAWVVDVTEV